jgi:hypothetical protein
VPPRIIQISADRLVHKGWTRDHMGLPAADVDLLAEPCTTVPLLLDEVQRRGGTTLAERAGSRIAQRRATGSAAQPRRAPQAGPDDIALWDMGAALAAARGARDVSVIRTPLGWHAGAFHFAIR